MKPITEKDILKAKAKGKKITTEDGSKISFFFKPRKEGKTLTAEQQFLKALVDQLDNQHKDTATLIQKLASAFQDLKVEVKHGPAPEIKVEIPPLETPNVLVNVDGPREWEFTVFRDHNGLIERLLAIRTK